MNKEWFLALPIQYRYCHQDLLEHPIHLRQMWEAFGVGLAHAVGCMGILGVLLVVPFMAMPFLFMGFWLTPGLFGYSWSFWLMVTPILYGVCQYSRHLGRLSGRVPWKVWLPGRVSSVLPWLLFGVVLFFTWKPLLRAVSFVVTFLMELLSR